MSDRPELFELADAESVVVRSRKLYKLLFREAKRMAEYRRMQASRERCVEFEAKLLRSARMLNGRLENPLPDRMVATVTGRVAGTIARWEHSPIRQRERGKRSGEKRRRRNRGRDGQIVYLRSCGESLRSIADRVGASVGSVRHVLKREAAAQRGSDVESDTAAG